jgi:hypothetical protein
MVVPVPTSGLPVLLFEPNICHDIPEAALELPLDHTCIAIGTNLRGKEKERR